MKVKSFIYHRKNLANEYLLVNILESYLRFTGIKQIDYLIIVDGNKNLNLKLIRQITSIKTVITNISTNEDVQNVVILIILN